MSALLWEREVGPLVTTSQLEALLRVSRQAINEGVWSHRIFALPMEQGDCVYPLWQFGPNSEPLRGIAEIVNLFADAVETTWTIASWLVADEPELDGRPPIEVLRSGDRADVLEAARRYAERLRR